MLVLGVGLYVLVVVYLGAYVRHAGVSLACADWPLCNGQSLVSFEGPTGLVFAHRIAALGAVLLLGWLARLTRLAGTGQGAALASFGTKFTLAPNAGLRWYLARRVSVRSDFRLVLWKLNYPISYKQPASDGSRVLPLTAALTDWTSHPWATIGVGWTF